MTLKSWLTATGIAGESEAERSSERNRRVVLGSVAGLALRGSALVVILVSVPLTLDLLGSVRFGMWMTLASVVALLGVMDLGIGNGVLNNVARAFGQDDPEASRRYFASGIVALASIAALLGIMFAVLYPHISWADVYNVAGDPTAAAEAGPATAAFIATFLIGLPLGVVGQVRFGQQEAFVQSAFAGLGNLFTLVLLIFAVGSRASLPVLVLAMTVGPLVASVINLGVLIRLQRPWLAPRMADVTRSALRSVLRVGLGFLFLQIAYTIAFTTDRLIVAHVVGPSAVADYSVVQRLFAVPAGLALIALLPLWPAYREAIARSDMKWVRATLRRSLLIVLAATVPLAIVLSLVGPTLVRVWTGGDLDPAGELYPAIAASTLALALATVFQMLLNGAQAMKFQYVVWSLTAVLSIVVCIRLTALIGVSGVAWGSAVVVFGVLVIPAFAYVPLLLRRLEGGAAKPADPVGSLPWADRFDVR